MSKPLAVLIVEDSESDAQILVRLLKKSDYAVVSERVDTAELMRTALTTRTWDIVLADYNMPQFDGRAALAILQATGADIPFIAVSGTMDEQTAVALMRAGAHDYLSKGDLSRLPPAVEREVAQANARAERRQADAMLSASEHRHRTLLHTAMDGYWLVDTQGRLLEVNEAYGRMSGYSPEELLGLRISELEAREAPAGVAEHIHKIMRLGEDRFETVHRRKDGSVFDVEIGAQFRSDEGGRFVCFLHDITRRNQNARALARIQQHTALILNSAAEGIIGLDVQGHHTFVNPAAARMLGYTPEELVGRESHSLWHHTKPDGNPYPREACSIYAAYQDGAVHHSSDEVFWRKDGTRFFVEYDSTPIHEAGRLVGAVMTFMDVTERKRAEEQLQQQLDELRRWQTVMLGISDRSMQLKREVNELLRRLGEPIRYPSQAEAGDG